MFILKLQCKQIERYYQAKSDFSMDILYLSHKLQFFKDVGYPTWRISSKDYCRLDTVRLCIILVSNRFGYEISHYLIIFCVANFFYRNTAINVTKVLKDIFNCNDVTIHETNTICWLDHQDIHSNDMIWIDKNLQTFS